MRALARESIHAASASRRKKEVEQDYNLQVAMRGLRMYGAHHSSATYGHSSSSSSALPRNPTSSHVAANDHPSHPPGIPEWGRDGHKSAPQPHSQRTVALLSHLRDELKATLSSLEPEASARRLGHSLTAETSFDHTKSRHFVGLTRTGERRGMHARAKPSAAARSRSRLPKPRRRRRRPVSAGKVRRVPPTSTMYGGAAAALVRSRRARPIPKRRKRPHSATTARRSARATPHGTLPAPEGPEHHAGPATRLENGTPQVLPRGPSNETNMQPRRAQADHNQADQSMPLQHDRPVVTTGGALQVVLENTLKVPRPSSPKPQQQPNGEPTSHTTSSWSTSGGSASDEEALNPSSASDSDSTYTLPTARTHQSQATGRFTLRSNGVSHGGGVSVQTSISSVFGHGQVMTPRSTFSTIDNVPSPSSLRHVKDAPLQPAPSTRPFHAAHRLLSRPHSARMLVLKGTASSTPLTSQDQTATNLTQLGTGANAMPTPSRTKTDASPVHAATPFSGPPSEGNTVTTMASPRVSSVPVELSPPSSHVVRPTASRVAETQAVAVTPDGFRSDSQLGKATSGFLRLAPLDLPAMSESSIESMHPKSHAAPRRGSQTSTPALEVSSVGDSSASEYEDDFHASADESVVAASVSASTLPGTSPPQHHAVQSAQRADGLGHAQAHQRRVVARLPTQHNPEGGVGGAVAVAASTVASVAESQNEPNVSTVATSKQQRVPPRVPDSSAVSFERKETSKHVHASRDRSRHRRRHHSRRSDRTHRTTPAQLLPTHPSFAVSHLRNSVAVSRARAPHMTASVPQLPPRAPRVGIQAAVSFTDFVHEVASFHGRGVSHPEPAASVGRPATGYGYTPLVRQAVPQSRLDHAASTPGQGRRVEYGMSRKLDQRSQVGQPSAHRHHAWRTPRHDSQQERRAAPPTRAVKSNDPPFNERAVYDEGRRAPRHDATTVREGVPRQHQTQQPFSPAPQPYMQSRMKRLRQRESAPGLTHHVDSGSPVRSSRLTSLPRSHHGHKTRFPESVLTRGYTNDAVDELDLSLWAPAVSDQVCALVSVTNTALRTLSLANCTRVTDVGIRNVFFSAQRGPSAARNLFALNLSALSVVDHRCVACSGVAISWV